MSKLTCPLRMSAVRTTRLAMAHPGHQHDPQRDTRPWQVSRPTQPSTSAVRGGASLDKWVSGPSGAAISWRATSLVWVSSSWAAHHLRSSPQPSREVLVSHHNHCPVESFEELRVDPPLPACHNTASTRSKW